MQCGGLSAERSQSGSAEMFIRFTNEILLRPDRQCGSCDFRTSLPGMAGSFSSAYCISRLSRKRLFFRNNNWYIYARACNAEEPRNFMVHRIQKAEVIRKTFEPDPEIYNNIRFTLTPVKDVVLRFHKDIHDSIFSNPFHENQEIIWDTDDKNSSSTAGNPGATNTGTKWEVDCRET